MLASLVQGHLSPWTAGLPNRLPHRQKGPESALRRPEFPAKTRPSRFSGLGVGLRLDAQLGVLDVHFQGVNARVYAQLGEDLENISGPQCFKRPAMAFWPRRMFTWQTPQLMRRSWSGARAWLRSTSEASTRSARFCPLPQAVITLRMGSNKRLGIGLNRRVDH